MNNPKIIMIKNNNFRNQYPNKDIRLILTIEPLIKNNNNFLH